MKTLKGRKAVIVLSDRIDAGSKSSLNDAVASALRSGTIVYSILFYDPDMYRNAAVLTSQRIQKGEVGVLGKDVLRRLSSPTGGRVFEVSKRMPLDKIYEAIEEELRHRYSIGYTPDATASAGYRRVRLTTRNKSLVVEAPEGYYPAVE
jgi:VWFA-related protein